MSDIKQVVLGHAVDYLEWIKGLNDEERLAHARVISLFPMDDLEPKARGIISKILEGRMSHVDLEGVQIHSDQLIAAMKGMGFYSPSVVSISEECLDILYKEDPVLRDVWKGIQVMCVREVEGSEIPPMDFDIAQVDEALNNVMAEVRKLSA